MGEQKRKGRHRGFGKRRGKAGARFPVKVLWMWRQKTLRRLLKKYRDAKKIDKHQYHKFYLEAKGNVYKNKRVLIEHIHTAKAEEQRQKEIQARWEKRRTAAQAKRSRKNARKQERIAAGIQVTRPL